jgi:glycerol kinase
MSSYILALDQGTTSCRSALVNHHGDICHIAQREFTQHFPKPGWVEHDAEEIWLAQMQTIQDVLRHGQDIAAIGITNQRETTLLWDRQTGQPLSRAIVWQDRRTTGMCERLRADGHELMIRQRTGLVVDAYFSGTKIAWLLDHLEGARERAERGELCFGTMDSWLVWQLTKGEVHITDATNASRTMLYNLHTGDWDADLCALLRVPMAILPTITESSGIQAKAQISENLRIPIAGIPAPKSAWRKTPTARAASC